MSNNRAVCPKCSQPVVIVFTEVYDATVIANQTIRARACIDAKEVIECACAPFTYEPKITGKDGLIYQITGVQNV